MTEKLISALGGAFVAMATFGTAADRAAAPITIDVHFTLTDHDSKPLAGQPVRLVLGSKPGWQNPDAGKRFVTDGNGESFQHESGP